MLAFDVVRRPCNDSGMLRRLINCRIIIIIIIINSKYSGTLCVLGQEYDEVYSPQKKHTLRQCKTTIQPSER